MFGPTSHGALAIAPNLVSLASTIPVPGFGALPANSFLIEGVEPVLIDTGIPALADQTIHALSTRLDPSDLSWIWLTHCDPDHIGAVEKLLALAPRARIVTNYLGMGKLSMRLGVPPERYYLINPGQSLNIGDRRLRAVSMPTYDAPETMGVFDPATQTLLSSDCFGALLSERDALGALEDVSTVSKASLSEGLATWTSVDAPWLAHTEASWFENSVAELERLAPKLILSAHLPPARDLLPDLVSYLHAARRATPFVGPDQAALEAMLAA